MDGDDAGPARDRGLPELRRRPAGPSPRHRSSTPRSSRWPSTRTPPSGWCEPKPGESFIAPFVVAASGILSVPLEPDIPGMATFAGTSLFTSRWPKEGFDLAGKRVGVIGTGSTGVQLIPVVAREAAQLYVFQRSPAYTLPWRVRRFEPGELDEMKARYDEIRAAQRAHPIGAARLSAFSVLLEMLGKPPLKSASREEQLRAIEENGVMGALNWGDIFFDIEANRMAAKLYGEAVARIVKDPETAAVVGARASLRVQAADHRPGLLRDVQPGQRHARRPA